MQLCQPWPQRDLPQQCTHQHVSQHHIIVPWALFHPSAVTVFVRAAIELVLSPARLSSGMTSMIPITPYSRREPPRLVGDDTGSTADTRSAVDHVKMEIGSAECFPLEQGMCTSVMACRADDSRHTEQ